MLRINRLTDYGTLVLTYLAFHPEQTRSATDVAVALGLGVPTVSKILKTLGRHELVRSNRGLRGGYSLSRAPETISVAEIIDALEEQPFGLTECSAKEGVCSFERNCRIRTNWQRINRIVRRTLEEVSLVDMMHVAPEDDAGADAAADEAQSAPAAKKKAGAREADRTKADRTKAGRAKAESVPAQAVPAPEHPAEPRPGKRAARARVAQP